MFFHEYTCLRIAILTSRQQKQESSEAKGEQGARRISGIITDDYFVQTENKQTQSRYCNPRPAGKARAIGTSQSLYKAINIANTTAHPPHTLKPVDTPLAAPVYATTALGEGIPIVGTTPDPLE